MTVDGQMLGFVAMAVAIVAILTVGTLAAADIIHVGRRKPEVPPREAESPKRPEETRSTLETSRR